MAIQQGRVARVGVGVRYAILGVGAALFLVPFYLVVRNGLMTERDITSPQWQWLPPALPWGNAPERFPDPAVPMAPSLPTAARTSVGPPGPLLVPSACAGSAAARTRPSS